MKNAPLLFIMIIFLFDLTSIFASDALVERESFKSDIADNFLGSIPKGNKVVNVFYTQSYPHLKTINNCDFTKRDYGMLEIVVRRDNLLSLEYETVSIYQANARHDDKCISLEKKLETEVLIKKSFAILSIDNFKNSIKSLIERKINELSPKHDGYFAYAKNKDRHLYDVFSINDTNKIFIGSPDQSYFMIAIPQKGYLHFFNQKFHSSLNDFLNLTDKRQHPNKIFTEEILPVDENNFFQHALDN